MPKSNKLTLVALERIDKSQGVFGNCWRLQTDAVVTFRAERSCAVAWSWFLGYLGCSHLGKQVILLTAVKQTRPMCKVAPKDAKAPSKKDSCNGTNARTWPYLLTSNACTSKGFLGHEAE